MNEMFWVMACVVSFLLGMAVTARAMTHRQATSKPVQPVQQPVDPLVKRLEAFQAERFASPIVQRTLDPDAVPARPVPPPLPKRGAEDNIALPLKRPRKKVAKKTDKKG